MSWLSDAWDRNIGNKTGFNFGSMFNPFERSGTLGNIITSAWDMMSGQATAQKQLELYNDQLKLSKEQLYKGHQIEVQDLINAGLNPILSAQSQGAQTTLPQIPNLSGLYGEGAFDKIMSIWGQTNQTRNTNSAVSLNKSQALLNEAKADEAAANIGLLNNQAAKESAQKSLMEAQKDVEEEKYNQQIWETQLAYYKVQTAYEELQYAKKHAKNKYEIEVAEKRYKQAEAEMKEKENGLFYFDWGWNKGMDLGKTAAQIYGVGKLSNAAKSMSMQLPGKIQKGVSDGISRYYNRGMVPYK